jgi:hypothetical protein
MDPDLTLEITDADLENIRIALKEMGEVFPDEEEAAPEDEVSRKPRRKAG